MTRAARIVPFDANGANRQNHESSRVNFSWWAVAVGVSFALWGLIIWGMTKLITLIF